jgi:predicted porin
MQKKIIALAIAGLVSGVAYAQTNVTIYGVADADYIYSKSDDNKFSGIDSGGWSGSRIGFRGEEALGNGLKAIFTYEFGTNIDTNTNFSTTRQAFVGLAGNFGSVTLGRQYAPSFFFLGATSANDITGINPINLALNNEFAVLGTGENSRWDNAIVYNSPNWSGLEFRAIYGFGEQVGPYRVGRGTPTFALDPTTGVVTATFPTVETGTHRTSDGGRFGLGARYTNGPLYLTAMYQAAKDSSSDLEDGVKSWAIGGNYDFKVVKVFANYVRQKFNWDSSDKQTLWSIGLGVPVSAAGTVHFEYMQFKDKFWDGDNKAKGYGVGYYHDLSKRTRIYTAISRINNDENMNWGFSKTKLADENNTNFQVGIRHMF